ncbi:hypothetical protein B0H13DRAFT_1906930 [Mycena leptocephala]|nr:hypothetical protein B0H13DRAFT_1906930 [Mycena leptocephala]
MPLAYSFPRLPLVLVPGSAGWRAVMNNWVSDAQAAEAEDTGVENAKDLACRSKWTKRSLAKLFGGAEKNHAIRLLQQEIDAEAVLMTAYAGGKGFVGKRTLVVGAGNSSADICQDLAFHGAAEATMLQRSTLWPPNVPTDVADFKSQAVPFLLIREIGKATTHHMWAQQKVTHEGLREAGLKLNMGTDGNGHYPLAYERFGGGDYHLDFMKFRLNVVPGLNVGVADLIRSGKVKIKQGVEIARFTENSAMFTDGSSLKIDAVVTSVGNIRDTMRGLLGNTVIEQTSTVWGVDEEGEINGCYRPSGHPGVSTSGKPEIL